LEDANASNPEQEALAHERENQLREALQSLRSAYREAVVLRDVEGLTYEEIAASLQINIGTVKSRLREDAWSCDASWKVLCKLKVNG